MSKNCNNCYWKFEVNIDEWCARGKAKPSEEFCDGHNYKCTCCDEEAEYKYENQYLCSKCILEKLGVKEYTVTHYTLDDEYLGSDGDIREVISNINKDIEELE